MSANITLVYLPCVRYVNSVSSTVNSLHRTSIHGISGTNFLQSQEFVLPLVQWWTSCMNFVTLHLTRLDPEMVPRGARATGKVDTQFELSLLCL